MEEDLFRTWTIILGVVGAVASVMTPLLIWYVSHRYNQYTKHLEHKLDRQKAIGDLRGEVYAELASNVQRIFQFSFQVGRWREISVEEVIDAKRSCDSIFFGRVAIWTPQVVSAYATFMDACFETKRGRGAGIRVRADIVRFREESHLFNESWEGYFMERQERERWLRSAGHESFRIDVVRPAYIDLASEIQVAMSGEAPSTEFKTALSKSMD